MTAPNATFIDPRHMHPTDPQRLKTLRDRARALGIENPDRFQASELESLLVALGNVEPHVPSSGTPPGEALDTAPQEAGRDTAPPPGARPSREPEPYRENPFFVEPVAKSPPRRGVDAVWLSAVDPETLFITWDMSAATVKGAQSAPTVVRIFSPDALGHVDVEVHLDAVGWYVRAPRDRVRLQALLGLGRDAAFVPVAESPVVSVPPRRALPHRAGYRVSVPYDLDRRRLPLNAARTWMEGGRVPVSSTPAQPPLGARMDRWSEPPPADVTSRDDAPAEVHATPAPALPEHPAPAWDVLMPRSEPGGPEPHEHPDDAQAAHWIGVARGGGTWEWRMGGPNSSDIMARGHWAWERHIHGIPRAPTGAAAVLPSSAELPSSGVLSSGTWMRARDGKEGA